MTLANYLPVLKTHFLVCKLGIILVPVSLNHCKDSMDLGYEISRTAPGM